MANILRINSVKGRGVTEEEEGFKQNVRWGKSGKEAVREEKKENQQEKAGGPSSKKGNLRAVERKFEDTGKRRGEGVKGKSPIGSC